MGRGSGACDNCLAKSARPEVVWIVRNRLRPAEKQWAIGKGKNNRQNNGAEHIQVYNRIKSEPPHEARCRVTKLVGGDAMHQFMDDSGKHYDGDKKYGVNNLHRSFYVTTFVLSIPYLLIRANKQVVTTTKQRDSFFDFYHRPPSSAPALLGGVCAV